MHVANAAATTPATTLQAAYRVFIMAVPYAQNEQSLASREAPQKF